MGKGREGTGERGVAERANAVQDLHWNVRQLMGMLSPANFPAHLVCEMVRRTAMGNLHNPEQFLEVVWPFRAVSIDTMEWDPLAPVLCRAPEVSSQNQVGTPTTMAAKLDWFQRLLFSDFITHQIKAKDAGLQPPRCLQMGARTRLQEQGTEAGVAALAPEEVAVWEDCIRCLMFVGAIVEEAAMTADQVAALSEVDIQRPKTIRQKVLATCCGMDVFWQQRISQAWQRGAVEASIGPKMQRIIEQLRSEGSAADAWATAKDRAPAPRSPL